MCFRCGQFQNLVNKNHYKLVPKHYAVIFLRMASNLPSPVKVSVLLSTCYLPKLSVIYSAECRISNAKSGCYNLLFCKFFADNCMKMKEFGPRGPLGSANSFYDNFFSWTVCQLLYAPHESENGTEHGTDLIIFLVCGIFCSQKNIFVLFSSRAV